MKKIFLILSLVALSVTTWSCGTSDMEKVRAKRVNNFLNDLASPAYESYKLAQTMKGEPIDSVTYVANLMVKLDSLAGVAMATQLEDGSWADVNYDCHLRGSWDAFKHLDRMSRMAKAYCVPESKYYQDEAALTGYRKGLAYWDVRKPNSTNWWANEIGAPRSAGGPLLALQDKLTPEEVAMGIRILEKSTIKITGQNKVWLCGNVMTRAMLTDDEELFDEAVREMKTVITVEFGDEGIQPDWSFHQHGRQQQFGNYGLSYISSLTQAGLLLQGTNYAFNADEIEIMRNYLLKGMSWVVWEGEMETGSCGRQTFVKNAMKGKANTYGLQLLSMERLDPDNAEYYKEMFEAQILDKGNILTGIKHFYMSDMTFERQEDWMAALKMCSDRTVGSEVVNDENLRCEIMANGSLAIYQDGGEYENIYPLWDWTRVPGVTNNFASHFDFPIHNRRVKGKTEIVGGLTKDDYGVSIMRVDANGLKLNKSWYFTDDYILCLGSDISSSNGNLVTTAINQTFLKGDAKYKNKGSEKFITAEKASGTQIEAVLHNNVGYWMPYTQNTTYTAGEQKGSWHTFHTDSKDTIVTGDVFNMVINHGRNPKKGDYCYVVVPRTDEEDLNELIAEPDFEIIKNTDDVHAVRFDDGTVRAAFFTPNTTLKVDDKIEVVGITEEVIMVFKREGNTVYVSYVDPTSEKDSTIITFKGKWEGENAYYIPEEDVSVVEFDTKISWGKRLEAVCQIID